MASEVVPSARNELLALGSLREVDALLRAKIPINDVARFVQEQLGRMRDVAPDTLRGVLSERLAQLKADDEASVVRHASENPSQPRQPGVLASSLYSRVASGVSSLVELEALYLFQRDRIGWLAGKEYGDGEHNKELHKELKMAVKILETHAGIMEQLGLTGGASKDSLEVSLKLKGVRSRHGDDVSQVMSNPESRQRVMNLANQIIGSGAAGVLAPSNDEPS